MSVDNAVSAQESREGKPRRKAGRPTKYNQKLADRICAKLAIGRSARSVLEEKGMPSMETFWRWVRENESFREQYARAKEEAADAMADDILSISDDGHNDWMLKHFGQQESWVENGEALQRSRLRVDTRKWIMAKMKPKKYGDKLDLTTDGKELPAPLFGALNATAGINQPGSDTQGSQNAGKIQ